MKEKILIKVKDGSATIYGATSDINVIVLDYDGLNVGEDLGVTYEYPENIMTSQEIEDYVEQEYENTKPEEREY